MTNHLISLVLEKLNIVFLATDRIKKFMKTKDILICKTRSILFRETIQSWLCLFRIRRMLTHLNLAVKYLGCKIIVWIIAIDFARKVLWRQNRVASYQKVTSVKHQNQCRGFQYLSVIKMKVLLKQEIAGTSLILKWTKSNVRWVLLQRVL